jgi:hypothetical protein
MIWFACKQCGKRHGRAESLAGTLVFCECGQGNRVPWSSTAPEPDPAEAPPAPAPAPAPPLRPRPWSPPPDDDRRGYDFPASRSPLRVPRPARRPNPAYCLNHDDVASEQTCADCRCSFCSACVVTLQGRTLCAPCKNFRVRVIDRPAPASAMAIVSFVVALISGPVSFILGIVAVGLNESSDGGGGVLLCLLALALPGVALALAWMALRDIETKPRVGGRALAATGATTALAGVLWGVGIATLMIARQVQG